MNSEKLILHLFLNLRNSTKSIKLCWTNAMDLKNERNCCIIGALFNPPSDMFVFMLFPWSICLSRLETYDAVSDTQKAVPEILFLI